jgi:predicted alpha/beta-hydrolase family hydrolase
MADHSPTLLLAHGAGAPMDSPFLETVAKHLEGHGVRVVRFEFPYMAARREGRRPGPDPMPRLEESFRTQFERVARTLPAGAVAVGGKSMGGRVATRVADALGARAIVVFGYPFHAPGKPELPEPNARTTHLRTLSTPTLILQGTRDPFGGREDVERYGLSAAIRVHWIEDGDHDLAARKKVSGRSKSEALAEACAVAAEFLKGATGS